MRLITGLPLACLPLACLLLAPLISAQDGPEQKPPVFLQNDRPKNGKESNTRIVDGIVKDAADNPLNEAIVQLKNTKTSTVIDFVTKDDGRYVFRDLPMDVTFELLAKHNDATTPVKKVSVFDTRKRVIVNFQIAPAKQ